MMRHLCQIMSMVSMSEMVALYIKSNRPETSWITKRVRDTNPEKP